MDKKTFAQFLLISTVILLGWWAASYMIYGPAARRAPAPGAVPEQRGAQPAAAARAQEPRPGEEAAPLPELAEQAQGQEPAPEIELVRLQNEHLQLLWTNAGAALARLTLLDSRFRAPYTEGDERPPLTLLRDFQQGLFSDTIEKVTFISKPAPQGPTTRFDVPTAGLPYRIVERGPEKVVFEQTVRGGPGQQLLIRKTVLLPPDAYHYEVSLEFENLSQSDYQVEFALRGAAGIEREILRTRNLGTRVAVRRGAGDYKIAKRPAPKLDTQDEEPNESSGIVWAAVVNHYFAAVLQPQDPDWISHVDSELVVEEDLVQARGRWNTPTLRRQNNRRALAANAMVVIHTVPVGLGPGQGHRQAYRLIAVPKDKDLLARYDSGMDKLIEFGMFSALSRIALAILNGIHSVLPNYGIAILILTLFVRLILHPLTRKQQISMIKMQKLQPQIAEIQRKYADDKQKQTQEQMALFQKYGVHPLSGCGPMLLQLPVFIALFRALSAAIELRHAGFLWISDLSRPDTIFRFPRSLPILGDEFNLLPLIMAGVMFWQQKGMPTAASEQAQQQQKMMKWFPLFFVLLLYHMPSGLVLYWTVSSGIGLLERWVINRHADRIELRPKGEPKRPARPRPGDVGKPKMTWMEKLQKMVEEQTDPARKGRKGRK